MIARRKFITLLGGATMVWPLAARAQQPERMRRIGILMNLAADDPEGQARVAAFLQGLQETGWVVGRNAQIDIRWGLSGDPERIRKNVTELVALTPDAIFATTFPIVAALQQMTRAVPIVFAGLIDPVGAGLVASLARPGGNTTGFAAYEYSLSVKWLELLKQVAPRLTRVAVLRDSLTPVGIGQLAAIQGVAPSFGVELTPLVVRDPDEIEPAVAAFARSQDDGLIVTIGTLTDAHRDAVGKLAARYRLPAIYPFPFFVRSGGLISYGPDIIESYRRAASYIDRILKGEKPADLPVQQATKIDLAINLKAAKALGLEVPPTLIARADEVIE
jgi:putative tryptophan/tyrosine transport system substrate-binding protein